MEELEKESSLFKEVISSISDKGIKLCFPNRIFWLSGAPGAGKGVNTRYIAQLLLIKPPAIVTSDLLQSPEAKAIKDAGGLVGDKEVMQLLFEQLLRPEYSQGVIVDGYPRTQGQVESLKQLEKLMNNLSSCEPSFPKASLSIILLYVNEQESIRRQLMRGEQIRQRNAEASEKGEPLEELRVTDTDPEAAKKRYQIFVETTFETLNGLQDTFKFYGIDASPNLEQVRENIKRAFGVK